jgi:sulfide dehydrogenase [flavocytochrome c] flavoprotein subunit
MPKTGHAANSQAKICAAAIVSDIKGVDMPEFAYSTSVYSLLSKKYAMSRTAVYRLKNNKIKAVSSGDSSAKAKKKTRLQESKYALGWYKSITADVFAKDGID